MSLKLTLQILKKSIEILVSFKKSVADVRTEYANTAEKTAELTQKTKRNDCC